MNNNELVWNYTEMKPQISVKKQNNTNFQINIKNNKTAELYETIFNTSTCNSDVFAWKDCDDITLEKAFRFTASLFGADLIESASSLTAVLKYSANS
jgi:hypothetical protein